MQTPPKDSPRFMLSLIVNTALDLSSKTINFLFALPQCTLDQLCPVTMKQTNFPRIL